jgi:rubredoxin
MRLLFPISSSAPMTQGSTGKEGNLRKWMCVVCGFIYDEALGLPDEGIEPGTRWEDVPDAWTCPDCGATKDDFEMVEID